MRGKTIAESVVFGLAVWPLAAGAPPRVYEVTVIQAPVCPPPLPGPPHSTARGLNDLGGVAGSRGQCYGGDGHLDAYVWTPESGLVTLPRPWGFDNAKAVDLNNLGQAVGYIDATTYVRAALWQDGEVINLGGGTWSSAYAINDSTQIVGEWKPLPGMSHGFVWQDGVMTDLGPILGASRSAALDISNAGHVTGFMGSGSFETWRAFILHDGLVTELPAIPGVDISVGRAINNLGHVAVRGSIIDGETFVHRSFLWDGNQLTDLGTLLGTTNCNAIDLNDQQQIVGNCDNLGPSTPFLWQDGVMANLRDLIPADPDLTLRDVYAINEAGQIAGSASYQGNFVGVLLTPEPPCPTDVNGDGLVNVLDLIGLLLCFGQPAIPGCVGEDINEDGNVDGLDLIELLFAFGTTCP